MRKYEVMYIVRPTLDQEAIAKEIANVNAIFTNNDSKVLEVNEWGLRELAYEIEKNRKGYYVVLNVEATKKNMGIIMKQLPNEVDKKIASKLLAKMLT